MSNLALAYDFEFPPPLPLKNTGVSQHSSDLESQAYAFEKERKNSILLGGMVSELISEMVTLQKECDSDNWDGYGARPLDKDSLEVSLRFLYSLPKTLSTPEVTIEPDGEVSFDWNNGRDRAFSVSIGATGKLSYAGLFGMNKTHGVEHFDENLPRSILENIQRVFKGENYSR